MSAAQSRRPATRSRSDDPIKCGPLHEQCCYEAAARAASVGQRRMMTAATRANANRRDGGGRRAGGALSAASASRSGRDCEQVAAARATDARRGSSPQMIVPPESWGAVRTPRPSPHRAPGSHRPTRRTCRPSLGDSPLTAQAAPWQSLRSGSFITRGYGRRRTVGAASWPTRDASAGPGGPARVDERARLVRRALVTVQVGSATIGSARHRRQRPPWRRRRAAIA
jgi:hypothetical protein